LSNITFSIMNCLQKYASPSETPCYQGFSPYPPPKSIDTVSIQTATCNNSIKSIIPASQQQVILFKRLNKSPKVRGIRFIFQGIRPAVKNIRFNVQTIRPGVQGIRPGVIALWPEEPAIASKSGAQGYMFGAQGLKSWPCGFMFGAQGQKGETLAGRVSHRDGRARHRDRGSGRRA
jgi:hypothetical protein